MTVQEGEVESVCEDHEAADLPLARVTFELDNVTRRHWVRDRQVEPMCDI